MYINKEIRDQVVSSARTFTWVLNTYFIFHFISVSHGEATLGEDSWGIVHAFASGHYFYGLFLIGLSYALWLGSGFLYTYLVKPACDEQEYDPFGS